MHPTSKYVGLDVHGTTTVVVTQNETGRALDRRVLATEQTAIVAFVRQLRGDVHVALEEGTQAQWLHDLLGPLVTRVVVADRRGAARGNKGDFRDASALADDLRTGRLHEVYHGRPSGAVLTDLARTYLTLVEDATRVMLRLKALFRARGIATPGHQVYERGERAAWLERLTVPSARFRAAVLYAALDVLLAQRPLVKAAFLAEAQRHPAWAALRTIPFLGPVRVAVLLALLQTPWRFRTKRQLWAYAGLAVVLRTSAEFAWVNGRAVRRPRAPLTRGLNQNHNRTIKALFKSTATAAMARAGAWQEWAAPLLTRGLRPPLVRLTVARKLAAIVLHVWKTGERYDPATLTRPTG